MDRRPRNRVNNRQNNDNEMELPMHDHDHRPDSHHGRAGGDQTEQGWVATATAERREAWAADRILDPGDTHTKGEASLCVGEAA